MNSHHSSLKTFALFASLLLTGSTLTSSPALANGGLTTTWAPIKKVFAPKGFDTNDETQIVVSGYLPNLCYKAPRAEASVVGKTISITVRATMHEGQIYCAQVILPFLEVISVGNLPKGDYQIVVNGPSRFAARAELQVVESAGPELDDHVYANVSRVESTPGSHKVVLSGTNPSDCFELDRIEFVSNQKDTYSILPILKQVKPQCAPQKVPFAWTVEVPSTLKGEEILLHVRAMDGRSVNALLEER